MGTRKRIAGTALLGLLAPSPLVVVVDAGPAFARNGVPAPRVVQLSPEETAWVLFIREEEKLARDVYLEMFDLWSAKVFDKIADSEQKHMDAMGRMVAKFGLVDPVLPEIGAFTDKNLQKLYDDLIASGEESCVAALRVGAAIEEIDMIDLQAAIDATSRVDLRTVYGHLMEGSMNHLRAFVKALAAQGVVYEPVYISQELFDAIMGL